MIRHQPASDLHIERIVRSYIFYLLFTSPTLLSPHIFAVSSLDIRTFSYVFLVTSAAQGCVESSVAQSGLGRYRPL